MAERFKAPVLKGASCAIHLSLTLPKSPVFWAFLALSFPAPPCLSRPVFEFAVPTGSQFRVQFFAALTTPRWRSAFAPAPDQADAVRRRAAIGDDAVAREGERHRLLGLLAADAEIEELGAILRVRESSRAAASSFSPA